MKETDRYIQKIGKNEKICPGNMLLFKRNDGSFYTQEVETRRNKWSFNSVNIDYTNHSMDNIGDYTFNNTDSNEYYLLGNELKKELHDSYVNVRNIINPLISEIKNEWRIYCAKHSVGISTEDYKYNFLKSKANSNNTKSGDYILCISNNCDYINIYRLDEKDDLKLNSYKAYSISLSANHFKMMHTVTMINNEDAIIENISLGFPSNFYHFKITESFFNKVLNECFKAMDIVQKERCKILSIIENYELENEKLLENE